MWLFVLGSSVFLKNLVVGLEGVMNLTVALDVDNRVTASLRTLLPKVATLGESSTFGCWGSHLRLQLDWYFGSHTSTRD
jgi:hypothetical protein